MSKGNGIRLSEEHGVNPTLMLCWICGEKNGELALLGRLREDAKAPRYMQGGSPCEKCIDRMKNGIVMIEANPGAGGVPERTGYWVVITEDGARRCISPEAIEQILKSRIAFMEPEVWDMLGIPREEKSGEPHAQ